MAIRTSCTHCSKSFSAQDEYLGKKVKCPSCGRKTLVVAEEERRSAAEREEEKKRWLAEQEKRIELIENLSRHERQSLAEAFGVSLDRVRNFQPGAITRFRKLRALSRFMLLGGYLFFPLVLGGALLTVQLYRESGASSPYLLALLLLGWLLVLVFAFFIFKFLGELSWLLADMGDHQLDVRNLLLDLRDSTDRARVMEKVATTDDGHRGAAATVPPGPS